MGSEQLIPQVAAIPFRLTPTAHVEVLLIRKISGGKWGIPKGLIDPGLSPDEAVRMEALEEAGVEGQLLAEPMGEFCYAKFGGVCRVLVLAMKVTHERPYFSEQDYRERAWFPIDQAAELVGRKPIRLMITDLAARIGQGTL